MISHKNKLMYYFRCQATLLVSSVITIVLCYINRSFFVCVFISTVPTPSVTVTALNTQTVGQPLTLTCNAVTVRGITSRVDVIWSRDGMVIRSTQGGNASLALGRTADYTDTYTISQLNTTDDGREYQCEVVINTSPPVMATGSIMLDVMGECVVR